MTPVTVSVSVQRTETRTMELTAEQCENIIRRWAQKNHGFSDRVEIESNASFDGMFSGMTLTEKTTSYEDSDDTPIWEN